VRIAKMLPADIVLMIWLIFCFSWFSKIVHYWQL
jgi:hypothetical protein